MKIIQPFAEEITFFEQPAIKVGNEYLECILVPSWGSNLISIIEKKTNTELLRVPASQAEFWENPVLYGTPILFPPNRIDKGAFTFRDRVYQFDINEVDKQNHIHGFVHTRKWEISKIEVKDQNITIITEFDSSKHEDVQRQFPHHFILQMTYILHDNVIEKSVEITNKSAETMPMGLGFHTSFLFPEATSRFALSVEKQWRLNERFLPSGELEEIPYQEKLNQGMSLMGMELDDAFLSSTNSEGMNMARLMYCNGIEIEYKVDQNFKHWVVFNKDGKSGFLCPEPYTWITNAPNLPVPASLSGIQELESGVTRKLKTSLTIISK